MSDAGLAELPRYRRAIRSHATRHARNSSFFMLPRFRHSVGALWMNALLA
jgi:hypothetical protein